MFEHPRAALSALLLSPCLLAQAQTQTQTPTQTVVVTGSAVAEPVKKELRTEQAATPGGVSLVDGEALRQRNVTSLADLLRYVPGLWAAGGGTGDSSFLSSRGSNLDATPYDGNGIKMLQDGLPVTAADGSNHNRDVDPMSARHVIVARGANALAYGASTLGGAMDFISPTARNGLAREALLYVGSHGQRQGRVSLGAVSGAADGMLTLESRRSSGYRQHHRQQRSGLYANAGWQVDSSVETRLYLTAIANNQQLPGALTRSQWQANPNQAQAAAVAGDYQYNVKTWRLASTTRWAIDAQSSLTAGLSYEEQRLFHPIVYAPPFFSLLINTELRNLGGTLRYQRQVGAHDLLAGLNLGRTAVVGGQYAYMPGGAATLSTRVDHQADSAELFVLDRWQFAPGWIAVYGAQAVSGGREVRNTSAASGALRNPKGRYDSVNPRLGLIHQLTPTAQVFANLSRLHEAPTLYELENDDRRDGSVLAPMKGTVLEVGTRGTHHTGRHRWHWDLALYMARLRHEILSRDDPTAPGTSLSLNADGTVHAGLEALLGASLALDAAGAHRLEPLVSLTVNRFHFDGDRTYGHRQLPAAPRHAVRAELLYRHASGLFAGPTLDVVGHRWADFSNTYSVPGHTLWGLRAGYANPQWEVFAEARNLADKAHVSMFSVRDVAAAGAALLTPGEPRSVYLGARLKY